MTETEAERTVRERDGLIAVVLEAARKIEAFSPFDPQGRSGVPAGFWSAINELNDATNAVLKKP